MGVVYKSTLSPSKIELLTQWVPTRPWGVAAELEQVGSFRFDDPAGEVGVETILVRAGDAVLQVPLTYRASKLFGADDHLITSAEHSVLGTRWVYDGCADPVYVAAVATAILTGGGQAEVVRESDGEQERVEPNMQVGGSGASDASAVPRVGRLTVTDEETTTTVTAGDLTVAVARVVDALTPGPLPSLSGTWPGREDRALLAQLAVTD